jgi:hypothetical protein
LGAGFKLKASEMGAVFISKDGTKNEGGDTRRIFVLNAAQQDQLTRLKDASQAVLENLDKNDPSYSKFAELYAHFTFLESEKTKLDGIDEILKSGDEKYNKDAFISKFREFRKSMESPKAAK